MARGVHAALLDAGARGGGEVLRLGLGPLRPYLVTHPTHVQQVLQERAETYRRGDDTAMWRSVRRFAGDGILAEGATWAASRRILAPLFRSSRMGAVGGPMAAAVAAAVADLEPAAADGRPVDIGAALTGIATAGIMPAFFADRLTVADLHRITTAQEVVVTSMAPRMLLPFVPWWVRMPGDRRFDAAVRSIDDILFPVVRSVRRTPGDGDDVVSVLARARRPDGGVLDERQIRDDLVAMIGVTTETAPVVLTWLWPELANRPGVTARLYAEVDRVVGAGPVRVEHVEHLRYLRMVLEELLRLYPAGWLLPRRAVAADVLGGVRVEAGATVLLSPYVTQRMPLFWGPDAAEFDPDRFAPGRAEAEGRHRYAHHPFGIGMHRCLGEHLFHLEAALIVANLLHRFRFTTADPTVPAPRVATSLRPGRPVLLTLASRRRPEE
ncbi:cytochrome P450 [Micromonospora fluostatini]